MPEFIRPKRATIETGGGMGEVLAMLALLAVPVVLVAMILLFVMAHILLIACCTAGAAVVMGLFVTWMRYVSSPKRLAGVLPSRESATTDSPASAVAEIPAPPGMKALPEPAQHRPRFPYLAPEDAAAVAKAIRRRPQ